MERLRLILALGALLALVCAGCACGGPNDPRGDDDIGDDDDDGICSDADGDGYGIGSDCLGPDYCDSIPDAWTEEQCDQICADYGNVAPGCECDSPEPEICYFGPPGTIGIGNCRAGLMRCEDGIWSSCDGQVLPGVEVCDEVDNDCDGDVDEGVRSACGDCNLDCEEECFGAGEGCEDFDPDAEGASGVVGTPEGGITLDGSSTIRNYVIWIANSSEGTVSKINTRTREEEGRYRTCAAGSYCSPSRTSVNHNGDVAVANRSGGFLTRFNAEDCFGGHTSDGPGDILDYGDDDCMIWATSIAGGASGLRGTGFELRIGLDGVVEEYVWTGSTSTGSVYEVEAEEGEQTGRQVDGLYPYGLAMGRDSKVWVFNGGGGGGAGVIEFQTTDRDLEKTFHAYAPGVTQYGITCDSQGRVWVGGSGGIGRYDPDRDEWEIVEGLTWTGGIACDGDDNAWTGELPGGAWGGAGGGPWRIDGDTLEADRLESGGGHGWGVDFDGYIWSVPFTGSFVTVTDPDTYEEDGRVNGLIGAYTYSDMTGFQLVNATNEFGIYPVIFEGCPDGMDVSWADLTWDAVVPPGTSLSFRFKTADDLVGLAAAPFFDLAMVPPDMAPIDIGAAMDAAGVIPGDLLYIELSLRSLAGDAAPTVNTISVSRSCDMQIG